MKIATGLLAGLGILAMGQAAQALMPSPTPTGTYAFMGWSQCEARFNVVKPGANVTAVNPVSSGVLGVEIGYITFAPSAAGSSTGNVTLTNRTQVEGGSLRINNNMFPWASVNEPSMSGTYAFTSTQFTITVPVEGALTFAMTQSNAGKTFYLVRKEGTKSCLNAITATRVAP